MDEEMAAAYFTLSPASFRAVTARAGVQPVDLGLARLRWRKVDLDRLIEGLPARGAAAVVDLAGDADALTAALRNVRTRGQGRQTAARHGAKR